MFLLMLLVTNARGKHCEMCEKFAREINYKTQEFSAPFILHHSNIFLVINYLKFGVPAQYIIMSHNNYTNV